MKIVHVCQSDVVGGASRAAYRLNKGLQRIGEDSRMLVQSKSGDDETVIGPQGKIGKAFGRMGPTLDALPLRLYKDRAPSLFSPGWFTYGNFVERINQCHADIVHLHWISGGMIRIEDVKRIKAPVVWSLHDMWPFTGGCHFDQECGRYSSGCGGCPLLGSSRRRDLSYAVFRRKQRAYAKLPSLALVGLSSWITDCAMRSPLFASLRIVTLPNPIDIESFKPLEKKIARELLGLPLGKKLVLFGAMQATSEPRKGFKELNAALRTANLPDTECVVFGSSKPANAPDFGMAVRYLGRLHDDITLCVLYSAVDVMVVPSLQENLSNIVMESLACGTPVVAVNIGGNRDLVDHMRNGYLAAPFDPADLLRGIEWTLQNATLRGLAVSAREKVVNNFEMAAVSRRYAELYEAVSRS